MEKKNTSVSEVEFLDMIVDEDEGFMESNEITIALFLSKIRILAQSETFL